jgi:hypothetical protein
MLIICTINGKKSKKVKERYIQVNNNKVEIQKTDRLIPQKMQTRHSHTKSFQIPSCKTEYRKESFFPRTITDWNKLPENIINSTSLGNLI